MSARVVTEDVRDDLVVVSSNAGAGAPDGEVGAAIDAARFLAADAVERAGSGHPGCCRSPRCSPWSRP